MASGYTHRGRTEKGYQRALCSAGTTLRSATMATVELTLEKTLSLSPWRGGTSAKKDYTPVRVYLDENGAEILQVGTI
jgi:hypothetical protein